MMLDSEVRPEFKAMVTELRDKITTMKAEVRQCRGNSAPIVHGELSGLLMYLDSIEARMLEIFEDEWWNRRRNGEVIFAALIDTEE